jgi:gas vesicle protein
MTPSSADDPSSETDAEHEASETDDRDLTELVDELRAEITRLKAQQAKAQTRNWIQRHPLLTVALSIGVGSAAGYGAAMAFRPRPPRTLSERARQRLRHLTDDAREVAARLRQQVGDRASASGAHLRSQAEDTGRRLASGALEAGEAAREGARSFAQGAGERLRDASDEVRHQIQERGEKAAEEVQSLGEDATDAAEQYAEQLVDTAADSSEEGRSTTRTLLTLAGIAAGGYLATKLRHWL